MLSSNIHIANLSPSEEDYLLAIARSDGPAKTSDLARRLDVADPSVTMMLSKLAAKGLVAKRPHQPVTLTPEGQQTASTLLRRHRLIELFLTRILGYGWEEVHVEANQLEHLVSDKFIERLNNLLGNPTSDPHGAPIPGADGSLQTANQQPLADLAAGSSGTISEVEDEDAEMLAYLGKLGLFPKCRLTVLDVAPYDGPMTLRLKRRKVVVGRPVCRSIWVRDVIDMEEINRSNNTPVGTIK